MDSVSIQPHAISEYISLTEAGTATISGDGDRLAYLSNESGLNQIWICDLDAGRPTGAPRQLTDLPERVVDLAFAPKGRDLVFTTDCGMDERHQIWLIPDADGSPRPLTDAPMRVHAWGCWAPEADRIAFGCNDCDAQIMDIHVLHVASGERRCVWQGGGYCEPLSFARDGRLLIRDSRRSMLDQDLLWLDPESGVSTSALPHDGPAQYPSVKLDPGGCGGIVLTDQGNNTVRPCRADFEAGILAPLHEASGWDIERIALPPARDRIACVVNRDGADEIEILDIATGKVTTLGAPGQGMLTSLSFADDGRRLIFSFAGPARPSAIWCWSEADGFAPMDLSGPCPLDPAHCTPKVQRLESFDGLQVPFFLYTPPGNAPKGGWPVLFMVHGGPESQWKAQFRPDILYHLWDRQVIALRRAVM